MFPQNWIDLILARGVLIFVVAGFTLLFGKVFLGWFIAMSLIFAAAYVLTYIFEQRDIRRYENVRNRAH